MRYICMVCQKTYKVDDVASPVKGLDYSHGVCDACEPAYRAQMRAELYEAGYKLKPKMVKSNSHVIEDVDEEPDYSVPIYFVVVMLVIYIVAVILIWNS